MERGSTYKRELMAQMIDPLERPTSGEGWAMEQGMRPSRKMWKLARRQQPRPLCHPEGGLGQPLGVHIKVYKGQHVCAGIDIFTNCSVVVFISFIPAVAPWSFGQLGLPGLLESLLVDSSHEKVPSALNSCPLHCWTNPWHALGEKHNEACTSKSAVQDSVW